jgi:hypothetical protein
LIHVDTGRKVETIQFALFVGIMENELFFEIFLPSTFDTSCYVLPKKPVLFFHRIDNIAPPFACIPVFTVPWFGIIVCLMPLGEAHLWGQWNEPMNQSMIACRFMSMERSCRWAVLFFQIILNIAFPFSQSRVVRKRISATSVSIVGWVVNRIYCWIRFVGLSWMLITVIIRIVMVLIL